MAQIIEKDVKSRELADELLRKALIQLHTSYEFKKKRMAKIKEAEDMMVGAIKQKTRQMFNQNLPTLYGLFNTLAADLDDPIIVRVKGRDDSVAVNLINKLLEVENKSLRPNLRVDYKDRISRRYAIAYGRAILKVFSTSKPYSAHIEAVDPNFFHCQPMGGGILERHLFAGEEGIIKTKSELIDGAKNGLYDLKQVKQLIERASSKDYADSLSALEEERYSRFKALGIDPQSHSYVGEATFNLAEWVLTHNGERWYLLFDPYTKTWLRLERLVDVNGSGYYPWVSYATDEDDKVFWSTSILADVLYPIADSINILFNQDLTNRQKINLNARAYDKEMFKNVQKLDEAQYKPDTLIPVDTFGGTRRIEAGIYTFTTPQLTGTIDMISWLEEFTGKHTGIYQPQIPPSNYKNPKASIIFANIQNLAKKIDYRSHSYTEAWGEITLRRIQGYKQNLSDEEAIEMIGTQAFGLKSLLKQINLTKDDIEILSTKQQNQEDALRKQQKAKSLEMILTNPILIQQTNPKWLLEHLLSDIGGWEQEEIEEAMDLRGMGGEAIQHDQAEYAIKKLIKGVMPELFYGATISFLRIIHDFASMHRLALGDKFPLFIDYIKAHAQIVTENMTQLAMRFKAAQAETFQPPQLTEPQPQSQPEKISIKKGRKKKIQIQTPGNKIAPTPSTSPKEIFVGPQL